LQNDLPGPIQKCLGGSGFVGIEPLGGSKYREKRQRHDPIGPKHHHILPKNKLLKLWCGIRITHWLARQSLPLAVSHTGERPISMSAVQTTMVFCCLAG